MLVMTQVVDIVADVVEVSGGLKELTESGGQPVERL